jgi:hypothetical protein
VLDSLTSLKLVVDGEIDKLVWDGTRGAQEAKRLVRFRRSMVVLLNGVLTSDGHSMAWTCEQLLSVATIMWDERKSSTTDLSQGIPVIKPPQRLGVDLPYTPQLLMEKERQRSAGGGKVPCTLCGPNKFVKDMRQYALSRRNLGVGEN